MVELDTEEEAKRFGKFALLRPIRKGGMGLLWVAYDTEGGRPVVLKRLHASEREGQAMARFTDEIELSFRLTHPNLVKALDRGECEGEPYLALEFIRGQDLDAILERARRFDQRVPITVVVGIVQKLLTAFEYAHAQVGFVHRDVSPANVLCGYDGEVRLLDFGLALWERKSSHTTPGIALGTLGYLAPEQRKLQKADARADLYSVGAIFWFLLTGLPSLAGGENRSSRVALELRLAEGGIGLSRELTAFLWRAMQEKPDERFQTAREMADALVEAAAERPAREDAIGAFVSGLFPVEKKTAADELEAWNGKYGTGNTALVARPREPSVAREAAVAANRTAKVPRYEETVGRGPLVALGVGSIALLLGGGMWLAQREAPVVATSVAPPRGEPVVTPLEPKRPVELPTGREPVVGAQRRAPPLGASKVTPPSVRAPAPPEHRSSPTAPVMAEPSAGKRLDEARGLARAGETAAARAILDELTSDARVRPKAKLLLAELDYKAGKYDSAIANASEAAKGGAGTRAYFIRATAALKAGRPAEAARDFEKVLATEPDNEDAREGLDHALKLSSGKTP